MRVIEEPDLLARITRALDGLPLGRGGVLLGAQYAAVGVQKHKDADQ